MPDIHIYDTRQHLGEAAAQAVTGTIEKLLTTQQTVSVIFAAAPSQNEFLAALIQKPIDWSRIIAFHMDEYLGLDTSAPQSFGQYLREHLFDKVTFNAVHFFNGAAADPEAECGRYAELLQTHRADIVCMGIGENTHLAFNDPPVADFNDPKTVKIVTLDKDCRQQQVNDGCFPMLEAVPRQALTITIPGLMAARYCFAMVPGERKAQAVYHTFKSPVTERYPSTILTKHPAAQIFLDRASSKLLPA